MYLYASKNEAFTKYGVFAGAPSPSNFPFFLASASDGRSEERASSAARKRETSGPFRANTAILDYFPALRLENSTALRAFTQIHYRYLCVVDILLGMEE